MYSIKENTMFGSLFHRNKDVKTDSADVNKTVEVAPISVPSTAEITPELSRASIEIDSPSNDVLVTPISDVITVAPTAAPIKEDTDLVLTPKHEKKKEEQPEIPPLTYKEMKALKRARYEQDIMNNSNFKKAYVLQNTRTGQMASIRAASSFHACNIIGWKVNRVKLLGEMEIKEPEKTQETPKVPETTGSSNIPT